MNTGHPVRLSLLAAVSVLMAACTTMPSGPNVTVLPGTGKTFDEFRADDDVCRQYALERIGGAAATKTAQESGVESAVVGTLIGAAAGAAIGGNHQGTAVGAGTGLLVGSMAGSGTAEASSYALQRRYDASYVQCMYAKGNQVPVSGRTVRRNEPAYYPPPPPPPAVAPPPPPMGAPPPPPPGVPAP
jgi:YmgG-like glycine-zipper protein